jgi:hypothetical protein
VIPQGLAGEIVAGSRDLSFDIPHAAAVFPRAIHGAIRGRESNIDVGGWRTGKYGHSGPFPNVR